MITSCPRESRSVPSVSGASMACPPGLSVIDRTSIRGLSASARAFAVLEAFTPERPSLALSEIARRAALPLTTTHRLLAELCESGALERNVDGTYRIGLRLWEIASLAPRSMPLREAALPFLEDL